MIGLIFLLFWLLAVLFLIGASIYWAGKLFRMGWDRARKKR